MDVDAEQEEEDAGQVKKRVKLSARPVGKGRVGSSDREEDDRSRKLSVRARKRSKRK